MSPIEWTFDNKKRRILWADEPDEDDPNSPEVEYRMWTTKEALRFAHRAGYVFARKFHRARGIDTFEALMDYIK